MNHTDDGQPEIGSYRHLLSRVSTAHYAEYDSLVVVSVTHTVVLHVLKQLKPPSSNQRWVL